MHAANWCFPAQRTIKRKLIPRMRRMAGSTKLQRGVISTREWPQWGSPDLLPSSPTSIVQTALSAHRWAWVYASVLLVRRPPVPRRPCFAIPATGAATADIAACKPGRAANWTTTTCTACNMVESADAMSLAVLNACPRIFVRLIFLSLRLRRGAFHAPSWRAGGNTRNPPFRP